ncbi:sigma-70 family RNA polymerase sigma factor [Azospirillum brasilense]|uniref:sigma-70 family RNA polymerase sigma factor n=1 Tax=Azospirillum brasilense TaxID=192 RepID=UPI000E68E207|nr:sigma-70 family RNA polymerase sigma factor [Azospirillum brasilense]NUB26578.1 RNA polymerase sigma factor SigJ [Azospirillum brasilense]NUB31671.1 RNA polymerase sigma factor SigJ [Azospirillum brasilense]RIW00548.1 RNA polymerase sigma factor SigJ [Azospirillum brasilense]
MNDVPADPSFFENRPDLIRLAYRMLGSVADAEDVVQDAYLRWLATDRETVRQPAALLRTIVTRLCLNELKSARRRRETYIGPCLPEPIVDMWESDSIDDITLPLMIALERLSPLERAAFLLHDVFGMEFDDVANAIGRDAAACRKLASRARGHIQAARPRFPVTKEHGLEIAAAFFAASRNGDMDRLRLLLADDVTASADGGGRVPASQRPLIGAGEVMARHVQLAQEFKQSPSLLIRYAIIDGLPGFISVEGGGMVQTSALQIERGKIVAIYITRNPDKLRHLNGVPVQQPTTQWRPSARMAERHGGCPWRVKSEPGCGPAKEASPHDSTCFPGSA